MSEKRVTVNFSESAYEALERFAQMRETTRGEALRDCIKWALWFQEQRMEGCKILVERNGHLNEVMLDGDNEDCPLKLRRR